MHPIDAVGDFLRREGLRGVRIACALSGGADSVCLLLCLLGWREAFALEISAVHIQHHLRGEESVRDEDFCRALCERAGVPLTVIPVDVKGYAAAHALSIETAARECRYAAFETLDCDYIATAHTASDQLETVIFRTARGTGLRGLCGIPPRRDRFLRPLLHVTRAEVEDFLQERDSSYVTDSSNLSDDYTRNRIRHRIVPELKEIAAGAERNAARMTDLLREDLDFIEASAEAAYQAILQPDGSLRGLRELHPALQSRCIATFLTENDLPHGFEAVQNVRALLGRGGQCDLDRKGRRVCYSRETLFVWQEMDTPEEILLQIGENVLFPGFCVTAEVLSRKDSAKFASVHKKFTDFVLDYDIIRGYAKLHRRRAGLRIRPAGRHHHVTVKKWLNESVPPAARAHIHFLSDDQGLIWAEGLGADERVRVRDTTQRMLVLYIHPTNT